MSDRMLRALTHRRRLPIFMTLVAVIGLGGCQAPDRPPAMATVAMRGEPRDAFVVLSGGGTPTSNNYSQYAQARAITQFLRERYPPDAIWVFFGQGNREGEPPVLADVYRQVKRDGLLLDTWLPGTLPENRVATEENFLRTLRTEILPRVRGGGTLYLFVGDHGELVRGKTPESAITLWGLKRDGSRPNGWATERSYELTVSELRQTLADGLGAGRVVFAMTQCHSGGFHELGIPREVQPPRHWFTNAPNWLGPEPEPLPPVAGFTATDEASIAAGCDPAPDPDTWFGYERFLPEQLLARDVLTLAPLTGIQPAPSFQEAHRAALLVDETIDKPRSTSEHYLERWAELIESRLSRELLLAPRVRDALEAYRNAVETGEQSGTDPAWQSAHAHYRALVTRMTEQNPATRRLLLFGRRAELEKPPVARTRSSQAEDDTPSAGGLSRAQSQVWREVLRPAWQKAVTARAVPGLPGAAFDFEQRLLQIETRGRPAGFSDDWSTRALNELYWASSYATPEKFNPATADAVTRWAATRRAIILAWAAESPESAVREAAAQFGREFRRERTPPAPTRERISANTAAARTLYYRRVLAAWTFLLALDHQPALAQLRALQALEAIPLPAATLSPAAPPS